MPLREVYTDEKCHTKCKIEDVLYVPKVGLNLFLASKLVLNGPTTCFDGSKVIIEWNKKFITTGNLVNKLYQLQFILQECEGFPGKCLISKDSEFWHKRLGHISHTSIEKHQILFVQSKMLLH